MSLGLRAQRRVENVVREWMDRRTLAHESASTVEIAALCERQR
jgi:hypothetical protein